MPGAEHVALALLHVILMPHPETGSGLSIQSSATRTRIRQLEKRMIDEGHLSPAELALAQPSAVQPALPAIAHPRLGSPLVRRQRGLCVFPLRGRSACRSISCTVRAAGGERCDKIVIESLHESGRHGACIRDMCVSTHRARVCVCRVGEVAVR